MKIQDQPRFGFSLVEVTLAMAVTTFCLIVILGLLPVGINSNQISINETVAASIASGIVSDLRPVAKISPYTSKVYGITIPTAVGTTSHTLFLKQDLTPAGTIDTDASAATHPLYRATIYFTVPTASATTSPATLVRLVISWPALADSSAAAAPKNFTGTYELFTALARN